MASVEQFGGSSRPTTSPLLLCDHLLRVAEEADVAGFSVAADHLVHLAMTVLDKPESLQATAFA